jgi:hypothetical protein
MVSHGEGSSNLERRANELPECAYKAGTNIRIQLFFFWIPYTYETRCNSNKPRFGQNSKSNIPRTRATQVEDDQPQSAPPDIQPSVSHLYTVPEHHFDLSHPDPDQDANQDF